MNGPAIIYSNVSVNVLFLCYWRLYTRVSSFTNNIQYLPQKHHEGDIGCLCAHTARMNDRVLSYLHFTHDVDLMGRTEKEALELTTRLGKHSTDIILWHGNGSYTNRVIWRTAAKVKISKRFENNARGSVNLLQSYVLKNGYNRHCKADTENQPHFHSISKTN